MTTPYPPFSGDFTTCPKCEGKMDKSYQPAGTVPRGAAIMFGHGPEWLRRECSDCDYAWAEMCADAS